MRGACPAAHHPCVTDPEPDPGSAHAAAMPRTEDDVPGSAVIPGAEADAAALVRRAEEDERAAHEVRQLALHEPIQPLPVPDDPAFATALEGEDLFAVRSSAILNAGRGDVPGYGGTLLLTTSRLLLVGQVTIALRLVDLQETALAGGRLLITLRDGEGVTLDVGQPRLLRAQIAAVRGRDR
jgi:hypothetical protein